MGSKTQRISYLICENFLVFQDKVIRINMLKPPCMSRVKFLLGVKILQCPMIRLDYELL